MDPVTALGVAAAAGQFLGTAITVGVRLKKYGGRTYELPAELEIISRRLEMLQSCLTDIKTRLERMRPHDPLLEDKSLHALNDFVAGLNGRCSRLEALLAEYLPSEEDSLADRLAKGLKSLSKDKEIGAIAQALLDDATLLTLRQITPVGSGSGGSASVNPNSQPVATSTILTNIPYDRRVSNLITRQDVLGNIDTAFASARRHDPRAVILQGMGGQGKTQLALEFCHGAKQARKYAGIFWVDAATPLTALKSFGAIATKIHPDGIFQDDEARMRFAKDSLESWTSPWLIVFDNYDDPASFPIKKYFPVSNLGSILITTRSPSTSALGTVVELPGMEESQALQLLFIQSGLPRDSKTEPHGKAIVKRLGYLPLAIAQIGSYLGERKDTLQLADFLDLYEREMPKLLSRTPDVWEYLDHADSEEGTQREQIKSIFTTWNFSLELLRHTEHSEQKIHVLSLLGFFAISDISESLFRAYFQSFGNDSDRPEWLRILGRDGAWATDLFRDLIFEFKRFSLISTASHSGEDGMIHVSLHPLVRDWIILQLQETEWHSCYAVASQMLAYNLLQHRWHLGTTYCSGFRIDQTLRRDYLSHLGVWEQNCLKRAQHQAPIWIRFVDEYSPSTVEGVYADFYMDCDMYQQSQVWLEWVWEKCDLLTQPWVYERLVAGFSLTDIYNLQKDNVNWPGRNEAMAQRNLEVCRQHGDASLIAYAEIDLADAIHRSDHAGGNREKEAIQMARILLQSCDLPDIRRTIMSRLANMLYSVGGDSLEEARLLARRIFEESEAEGAGNRYRANWTQREWGIVVSCLPGSDARVALAREYITTMAQLAGTNHRFYIYAKQCLGDSLLDIEQFDDAAEVYEACVFALEQSGIAEHILEQCLFSLGLCYQMLGRLKDAVLMFTRCVFRCQSQTTWDSRWVWMEASASHLSDAHEGLGDFENMLSAANFRLASIEHIRWKSDGRATAIVHAHVQAFRAKKKLVGTDSCPRFAVDQVICHLDAALSAVVTQSHNQRGHDTNERPTMGDGSEAGTSSGLVSAGQLGVQLGGWYSFDLVAEKALYLSERHLYGEAIKLFYLAKRGFEASLNLIGEEDVWWFLGHTWSILDEVANTVQDLEAASLISWTCSTARDRLGDVEATRLRVCEGIGSRTRLLKHLPSDEPYVDGIRPAVTQNIGSKIRRGFLKALPLKLRHSRQDSAK